MISSVKYFSSVHHIRFGLRSIVAVTSRGTYGSQWRMYVYVGRLVGYIARSSQPGDQTSLDAMALDTGLLPHHIKNDLLGQCQDASRFCGWQQSHSRLRRPSTEST
jgi:hypothetical protein